MLEEGCNEEVVLLTLEQHNRAQMNQMKWNETKNLHYDIFDSNNESNFNSTVNHSVDTDILVFQHCIIYHIYSVPIDFALSALPQFAIKFSSSRPVHRPFLSLSSSAPPLPLPIYGCYPSLYLPTTRVTKYPAKIRLWFTVQSRKSEVGTE